MHLRSFSPRRQPPPAVRTASFSWPETGKLLHLPAWKVDAFLVQLLTDISTALLAFSVPTRPAGFRRFNEVQALMLPWWVISFVTQDHSLKGVAESWTPFCSVCTEPQHSSQHRFLGSHINWCGGHHAEKKNPFLNYAICNAPSGSRSIKQRGGEKES